MPSSGFSGYGPAKTLTLTGTVYLEWDATFTSTSPFISSEIATSQVVVGYGALPQITFTSFNGSNWTGGAGTTPRWSVGVTAQFLATTYHFVVQTYTAATYPLSASYSATLDWEIMLDAAFVFSYTLPSAAAGQMYSGPDGLIMPNYQGADTLTVTMGSRNPDHPSGAGGWSYTASLGSDTASQSGTWGTGSPSLFTSTSSGEPTDRVRISTLVRIGGSTLRTRSAGATWLYGTASLSTGATFTYTESFHPLTVVNTYGTNSITTTLTGKSNATFGVANGLGSVDVAPPKNLYWKGAIKGLTGALVDGSGTPLDPTVSIFQDSTSASYTATGGAYERAILQRWERVNTGNALDFLNTTPYGFISALLPESWMNNANGYVNREASSPANLTNYGSVFHHKDRRLTGAISLSLAPTVAITGGTDSSVTTPSPGGVRRSWGSKQSLMGYRYLAISVGTAIASGGKVRIIRSSNTYEWTQTAGGAPISGAGPFLLDLCHPTNAPVEVDTTITSYPEDGSGMRTGEGWLTGPSWVDGLEVLGAISGGGATSITGISLSRGPGDEPDRAALLTCLNQQGAYSPMGTVTSTSGVWGRPFLTITADGRVESTSETDTRYLKLSTDLWQPTQNSVTDMVALLTHARNPGITATNLLAARGSTSDWYDRELPSVGLMGAGWLWKASTQSWECTIDTPLTGGTAPIIGGSLISVDGTAVPDTTPPADDSLTLEYQLGAGRISVPGNAGDLFGHESTPPTDPSRTLLVAIATIHSQVYGVVMGDGIAPEDTATIVVRTKIGTGITTVTDRGSGTTNGLGYYATGAPWMRGYRVPHDSVGEATTTVYASPRRRFPVRYISSGMTGLELLNADSGWVALVTVESGRLRWRRWELPVPLGATPVADALITSDYHDAQPSLAYQLGQRTVLLFYRRDGASGAGVYEIFSDDDGDTWSTPTLSIPSGQQPRQAIDISGGLLRVAWVADTATVGNLKATWQAAGDTSPSAVFTLTNKATSAALRVGKKGYDVSAAGDSGSRFNLTVTLEGETDTSNWYSEDDGRTWTRS